MNDWNIREQGEAFMRSIMERDQYQQETIARQAVDIMERDKQISELTTENAVLKGQLQSIHQEITFEADFEIEEA